MTAYEFPQPLERATLLYKKARFVGIVRSESGEELRCYLPPTVAIGDFVLEDVPCLLQENPPGRRTSHTIKAISLSEGASWVGIDLNFSNALVEHFARQGDMREMLGDFQSLRREVKLGNSRLDFLVDDLWMEVKTPVDTIHHTLAPSLRLREGDAEIVTAPEEKDAEKIERRQALNPGRMERQVLDLMEPLKRGGRAALLTVHQYVPNMKKAYRQTTKKQTIKETLQGAYDLGLESWKLDLEFTPEEVRLHRLHASRINR